MNGFLEFQTVNIHGVISELHKVQQWQPPTKFIPFKFCTAWKFIGGYTRSSAYEYQVARFELLSVVLRAVSRHDACYTPSKGHVQATNCFSLNTKISLNLNFTAKSG